MLLGWLSDGVEPRIKVDRDVLIQQVLNLTEQLGWDKKKAVQELQHRYQKTTRIELTDWELTDFCSYLVGLTVDHVA